MTPGYFRVQARYIGRHGHPVGIFGVCHHLRRAGRLSPDDDRLFAEIDSWFDRNLPNPAFYEDGNSIKAITWFKASATHLLDTLAPLRDLLQRHGIDCDVVECDDPGRIVYEDEFQVGVVLSPREIDTPFRGQRPVVPSPFDSSQATDC